MAIMGIANVKVEKRVQIIWDKSNDYANNKPHISCQPLMPLTGQILSHAVITNHVANFLKTRYTYLTFIKCKTSSQHALYSTGSKSIIFGVLHCALIH